MLKSNICAVHVFALVGDVIQVANQHVRGAVSEVESPLFAAVLCSFGLSSLQVGHPCFLFFCLAKNEPT